MKASLSLDKNLLHTKKVHNFYNFSLKYKSTHSHERVGTNRSSIGLLELPQIAFKVSATSLQNSPFCSLEKFPAEKCSLEKVLGSFEILQSPLFYIPFRYNF